MKMSNGEERIRTVISRVDFPVTSPSRVTSSDVTCASPRIQPPASIGSSSSMVRSTIIVRASDALPLAASVDDEQVGFNSLHLSILLIPT